MRHFQKKGYIALITAIILTAIVLAVAVSLSSTTFLARFDSVGVELKDMSRFIAKGCLEYARFNLASSSGWAGNVTTTINGYSCYVYAPQGVGTTTVIQSTATINNRTTNLKMTVATSTLKVIFLEELSSF
ncbi:hypothetical protein HY967_01075 [Candidatus Jorgensenbacteria bacterium]|nr:hypothetical protein [Candidatus Jorgensenbacteria bacterium]